MNITGEYCKELVDGKFVIELDLIEFEILDDLLKIAINAIDCGVAHNEPLGADNLESFAYELLNKKDGLICDEIDKHALIKSLSNEISPSHAN